MSHQITSVFARQILDSRGNPTVEVELSDGRHTARAAVPSGASTGSHEALELRDGDKSKYLGKGVLKAVDNVNTLLGPKVIGHDPADQKSLDQLMIDLDGTEHKSNLGANAILGISLAAARLAALQKDIPLYKHIGQLFTIHHSSFTKKFSLPFPMMNIINGGSHADSGLAVQEFMVMPQFEAFADNLRAGAEIFHHLKKILSSRGLAVGVGDEGGFAPHIPTVEKALDTIMEAITAAGYDSGNVKLALDAAASEFYDEKTKQYSLDNNPYSSSELVDFYGKLIDQYPIISIEDSHHEDDFGGFQMMQQQYGARCQLVGDDLLVTNKKRLQQAIDEGLCNAILIKVNQIGSLSETLETIALAKKHDFGIVISHRSGETEDTFIADLTVGVDAGQIKTGSLSRSERICKYNQLLRIGEQL